MKNQEIFTFVELSVRKYLGMEKGRDAWLFEKRAMGIIINNGVYDYKTGEKYNYVKRDHKGRIMLKSEEAVIGMVYAIEDRQLHRSLKEINKYVSLSDLYEEEYKRMKVRKLKLN